MLQFADHIAPSSEELYMVLFVPPLTEYVGLGAIDVLILDVYIEEADDKPDIPRVLVHVENRIRGVTEVSIVKYMKVERESKNRPALKPELSIAQLFLIEQCGVFL